MNILWNCDSRISPEFANASAPNHLHGSVFLNCVLWEHLGCLTN